MKEDYKGVKLSPGPMTARLKRADPVVNPLSISTSAHDVSQNVEQPQTGYRPLTDS